MELRCELNEGVDRGVYSSRHCRSFVVFLLTCTEDVSQLGAVGFFLLDGGRGTESTGVYESPVHAAEFIKVTRANYGARGGGA